jgi:hypothetical protein
MAGSGSTGGGLCRLEVWRVPRKGERLTVTLQATAGPTEMGMEPRKFETSETMAAPSRRAAHCASLSVILLSAGDRANLDRALSAITGRCRRLEAEIIVVRMHLGADFEMLSAAYPGIRFVEAPHQSTIVAMRELGMQFASGDIVTLRNDDAVGDGMWLSVFDATVGVVDEPVLMDSEVPMLPVSDNSIAVFEQARRQGRGFGAASGVVARRDLHDDANFAVASLQPVADTPTSSQREI